ncbi:MAG: Tim44 domain-containing protein [Desulfovibrio sp.]|uniref:Tim44 domain-containing protein n=1 Tax=Desulfovibrio sp. 7SRBS1 TaxID=3378064 RepID=UPI003B3FBBAA
MKRLALLGLPFLIFGLIMAATEIAHAKRFGGSRSFGSSPSYSRSAPRPAPSFGTNQKSTMQRPGTTGQRGFGGMGMFGGLLAGSLLGSLFFGRGFGGGFGIFDILIIGLGIYFLMRFLRSRRPREDMSGINPTRRAEYTRSGTNPYNAADAAWDNLSSEPRRPMGPQGEGSDPSVNTPPGFDADEFIKGAKAVYNRLQQSWDVRDLDDIREFTTDAVYKEIKSQAEEDPQPSKTEVLLVNARLLEAKQEGEITHATVYYDVMMREDVSLSSTEQVREVWHFIRDSRDASSTWRLDGIQQLED